MCQKIEGEEGCAYLQSFLARGLSSASCGQAEVACHEDNLSALPMHDSLPEWKL